MSQSKRHHHVPQFLLRNMSDSEKLYYFSKHHPKNGIKARNPESIFQKRNLYTRIDINGNKDTDVEDVYLSNLDNRASLVIDKILTSVRQGATPNLSKTDRDTWDEFFTTQMQRSLESMVSEKNLTNLSDTFEETILGLNGFVDDSELGLSFQQRLNSVRESKDRIIKGSLAKSVKAPLDESMEVLSQRGLSFGIILGQKSWIIGSSPHVRFSNRGSNSLYDLRTELWLPISHDVVVSPGHTANSEDEGVFRLSDKNHELIRTFNRTIYHQSSQVASHSPALLKSFASRDGHKQIKIHY